MEVLVEYGLDGRNLPHEDAARRTVNGYPLALRDGRAVHAELLLAVVDIQNARAAHARFAHASRDDGRVARHAAARRDDCLRGDHAVKVVGARLLSYEHDHLAVARKLFRFVRVEDDLALRRAGARGQTLRDYLRVGLRVNGRVKKLVELFGRDAAHGRRLVNQTLTHHLDGDLNGGRARALARARL